MSNESENTKEPMTLSEFWKDYKYFMGKHFSVRAIGLIALVIFTYELVHYL